MSSGGDWWGARPLEVKSTDADTISARINSIYGASLAFGNIVRPEGMNTLAFQILSDSFWYKPGEWRNKTFTDGFVNPATDTVFLTVVGFEKGDGPYQFTTDGVLPVGLELETDYWTSPSPLPSYRFYLTQSDAVNETNWVSIVSAAGGGTHSVGLMASATPTTTGEQGVEGSILYAATEKSLIHYVSAPNKATFLGTAVSASMVYWWLP